MARAQGLYTQGKDESGLTDRQRFVLEALTGKSLSGGDAQKMNQMQIADHLGISRQRVRQIVEGLLEKGHEIPGVKPRRSPDPVGSG
jgi:DNA-directed RNA polymerase sigma subunit (sigma70/sigma32)